ncbi:phage shock protein C (PspC) family protein [Mucilaginibacter mallensis]|uniref:Phage shock protein C (PspC) family protein n=1 Tax=Mucilaginibacter mallensis TaxID=652787 RepID=A0A1H2BR63_MUCMA|nr:PspC domain-containing protein [Mucilaginibacter mallensis]SDT60741.1 phage shock protein C (PspC) family protein [Mucilaginibacter mallensis]
MNKTIIININGTVFHIEEDAYEILKEYMTNVKRHFLNSADSLEITTDIENRLAEMFSEILTHENKQVVVEQDVQSVIEQMGTVDEFDEIYEDAKTDTNSTNTYATGERRLFRDPDDHLVSGVCAGIANYFNIEPVWIRLAFALSFFFAGSGLLLYIILWIVIPKALTRADRMAMKGEKLNLQGFKNNLEEELSSVRNHLNNLGQEARPFVYKLRDFITDFAHHLGLFFNGAGKILIKILGVIILLAFFAGAIALVVTLVAFLGFGAGHGNGMFPMSIWVNEHADRIYIAAFLTAFIPVLTIILMLISAVFNTASISRSTGTTILVVWICAVSVLVFYIAKVGSNFRESASFTQTVNLKATPNNVYYLKLDNVKYLTRDDSLRLDVKNNFRNMILTNDFEDDPEPRNISVSIERSDISQPVMIESFTAKGHNYENALLNARDTKYIYIQEDSVLKLDDKLRRSPNSSWHAEYLDITIKLPLNSKVIIDQELNNRINLNNVSVNDCKNLNKQYNASSAAFIMTDNGLQCKVDTVVTVKTQTQIDSARKATSAKTIAKLQAQIDSTRKADSVLKHK